MLQFLDVANAITLAALLSAAACALLAVSGRPAYAAIALIAAGVCDLIDGPIARRLARSQEQQRFGGRLDSLVDACAFGFAPLVMLYASGLRSPFDLPLLGLFLGCAIWRLAYFDTLGMETEGSSRYFVGLPTTYVALVLPLVYFVALAGPTWFCNVARIAVVALAAAMVSPIRNRKPGRIAYVCLMLLGVAAAGGLLALGPALHSILRT